MSETMEGGTKAYYKVKDEHLNLVWVTHVYPNEEERRGGPPRLFGSCFFFKLKKRNKK